MSEPFEKLLKSDDKYEKNIVARYKNFEVWIIPDEKSKNFEILYKKKKGTFLREKGKIENFCKFRNVKCEFEERVFLTIYDITLDKRGLEILRGIDKILGLPKAPYK